MPCDAFGNVEIAGAYVPRSSPPRSTRTSADTVFFWPLRSELRAEVRDRVAAHGRRLPRASRTSRLVVYADDDASATATITTPTWTTSPPYRRGLPRTVRTSASGPRLAGRPAAAAGADDELADDAGHRERGQPEREHLRELAGAERDRDDHGERARPRRHEQAVAQHLAARRPPRQRRRRRHEEQQREAESASSSGRSTARPPTAAGPGAPRRAAGTRCRAARRTRARRTAGCWRGTPTHATPASRCARARAAGRPARR